MAKGNFQIRVEINMDHFSDLIELINSKIDEQAETYKSKMNEADAAGQTERGNIYSAVCRSLTSIQLALNSVQKELLARAMAAANESVLEAVDEIKTGAEP